MNRCEVMKVTRAADGSILFTWSQCRHRTRQQKMGRYLCGMHTKMLDRGAELVYVERV